MYMYISILCARTIPGLSRSMVCARAIRGLRGQSMVCGTNHGSRVCAGQSRDCANPCFAHNRYMERILYLHMYYVIFSRNLNRILLFWSDDAILIYGPLSFLPRPFTWSPVLHYQFKPLSINILHFRSSS